MEVVKKEAVKKTSRKSKSVVKADEKRVEARQLAVGEIEAILKKYKLKIVGIFDEQDVNSLFAKMHREEVRIMVTHKIVLENDRVDEGAPDEVVPKKK